MRLLAKDCGYANSKEMIRDRVVFGVDSHKVCEKLLNVGSDLTLDKARDIARSYEIERVQLKTIRAANFSKNLGVRFGSSPRKSFCELHSPQRRVYTAA